MRRVLVLLFSLIAWLVPAAAYADPPTGSDGFARVLEASLGRRGGLTVEETARRAAATSPSIEAARADLRAAGEQTTAATYGFVPRVTARTRYTRYSEVDSAEGLPIEITPIVDQYTAELALDVPLSDYVFRLPAQRAAAARTEDAAIESLDATRQDVMLRARLVYWAWARARLAIVVTEEALVEARSHLEDTRANHEAGNASLADVLRADSAVSSTELALVRARSRETRLADELRTIARLPSDRELQIGEDLETIEERPESLASLLSEAYLLRPELRALGSLAGAERERATVARTGAFPRVNAFAVGQLANPNQREFPQVEEWDLGWYAGLEMNWGLTAIGSSLADARSAEARADSLDAEREALRDAIRTEVVDALESIHEADASIATTERGLDSAEEQYRVRRELYLAGRATASEVLDAETALTNARLDAIGARIDRRVADVELAHAVGR
jgi:outer membrane protein